MGRKGEIQARELEVKSMKWLKIQVVEVKRTLRHGLDERFSDRILTPELLAYAEITQTLQSFSNPNYKSRFQKDFIQFVYFCSS